MARIRSSRWWGGLTSILATVFLGTVTFLVFWDWPHPATPGPEPTVIYITASPEPTVVVHPAPLAAQPLTLDILDSVGEGWILVEYDSSAGRYGPPEAGPMPTPTGEGATSTGDQGVGEPGWEIPGPTYLYAVDPSGTLFEAADLGVGTGRRIALWLPDLRTAVVEQSTPGGVTLHTFDLVTGGLSGRFPGPGGSASGVWVDPELGLASDGRGMWVSFDDGTGRRGLSLIGLDGTPLASLVEPGRFAGFIESVDGAVVVTIEGRDESQLSVVSYAVPGTSIYPEPTPSAASPGLTPAPTATPGPTPSEYERVEHGMPPGEQNCTPASWPENRQLLIACTSSRGAWILYTVALMTGTFVDVTTYAPLQGQPFLLFNGDGSRVARGSLVANAVGDTSWTTPERESRPIGLLWTGDILVSWGDTDTPPASGHGMPTITARYASRGDLAYVLRGHRGAAGFGTVVAAPAVAP